MSLISKMLKVVEWVEELSDYSIYSVLFWVFAVLLALVTWFDYTIIISVVIVFGLWYCMSEITNNPGGSFAAVIIGLGIIIITTVSHQTYQDNNSVNVLTKELKISNLKFADAKNVSEFSGIMYTIDGMIYDRHTFDGRLFNNDETATYLKIKLDYINNKQCYIQYYNNEYNNEVLSSFTNIICK